MNEPKKKQVVYLVERTPCCYESAFEIQKIFFEEEKTQAKGWMDKKSKREKTKFAVWRVRKFSITANLEQ